MTDTTTLLSIISAKLDTGLNATYDVPAPLILFGAKNKAGLSANKIVSEIITDRQSIGIPIGNLPDGSPSIDEKMEYIRIERIIQNFIQNAKITIVIPAGVPVTATGISAAGVPVTVQGTTTNYATGWGIIQ